jgi:hypothetical protein
MWSADHERQAIEQVHQLVSPMAEWLQEAGLDDIPARCLGIWSLYYVGFRRAVIHGGNADDCLEAIKPSLRFYLAHQPRQCGVDRMNTPMRMHGRLLVALLLVLSHFGLASAAPRA